MFNNIGSKLKKLAFIMFGVFLIASLVLAFVFGSVEYEYHDFYGWHTKTKIDAVPFFLYLIGGSIYAYISSMLTYAFGALVENTQHIKDGIDKLTENNDFAVLGATGTDDTAVNSENQSSIEEETTVSSDTNT